MTALKEALKDAGFKSLDERIRALVEPIQKHTADYEEALERAFIAVAKEPAMLRHIFLPFARTAFRPYFADAAQAASRSGHSKSAAQLRSAGSAPLSGGGGQKGHASHAIIAPAVNPPRIPTAMTGRIFTMLLLDKVMPNGKKFRECSKEELEGMGRTLGREAFRCVAVASQLTAPNQTVDDAGITEEEVRRVDATRNGGADAA